jgi:sortase A
MPATDPNSIEIEHQQLIQLYRHALTKGESLQDLDQKVAKKLQRLTVAQQVEQNHDQQKTQQLKKSLPLPVRLGASLVPAALIVVGLLLLGSAVMPVVGFYVKNFSQAKSQQLASPIPPDKVLDVTPLVVAQADSEHNLGSDFGGDLGKLNSGPVIVDAELDYTNLSSWFEDENLSELKQRTSLLSDEIGRYTIDIPKVEIDDAVVKIGGTNLDESLIQYPGTSLPGKPGSPVVFGHSVLRQFYNPKKTNPRRYNSIFSYIMTLEKGDRFYVHYGGAKYTYMVKSKSEVKPTDTYILAQDYSQRQFKLVTCVPEGTYLRRGVVTAQLVRE